MIRSLWCWGVAICLANAGCCGLAHAQSRMDKTRSVYRCEQQGRVSYSDEPCLGAKEVDVTPTQGLDKSSGVSRKGADVQRAERDKLMAEALRPLTGLDAKGLEQAGRRTQLAPDAQRACRQLDQQLPALKAAEVQAADDAAKAQAELLLYRARKSFKELRC